MFYFRKQDEVKCEEMWFKPKSVSDDESPPVFSIDDDVLKEVSNQKYLGIVFDSKLIKLERSDISSMQKNVLSPILG